MTFADRLFYFPESLQIFARIGPPQAQLDCAKPLLQQLGRFFQQRLEGMMPRPLEL